uniref:Uncharacterized protein n=1 Tax=Arundo donax TaxID=35708 RepID=A0A0A8XQ98_ARUDO
MKASNTNVAENSHVMHTPSPRKPHFFLHVQINTNRLNNETNQLVCRSNKWPAPAAAYTNALRSATVDTTATP